MHASSHASFPHASSHCPLLTLPGAECRVPCGNIDMCQVNGKFYWPHMANATAHIPCIVTRQKKVKVLADWLAFYGEPVSLLSFSSLCVSMCLFAPCRVYVYLVRREDLFS